MKKINNVLGLAMFAIAAFLAVASVFKGAYLFYEACAYAVLGVCIRDTAKKDEEAK